MSPIPTGWRWRSGRSKFFDLKPKFGRNVRKRNGYLGGSIEERVDDLHAMFADPSVDAVFAIRGGYGSGQLLDRIDYDLLRKNPKIFLGYSDITAMHLAIQKRAGLVTFHGPVALSGFSHYTQKHFRRALFETEPLGRVDQSAGIEPSCGRRTRCARSGREGARAADGRQPDADLDHHGDALRNRYARADPVASKTSTSSPTASTAC